MSTPSPRIAPARAVEVVRRPAGLRRELDGVVPGLHYYFDEKGSRWRLVYILENVPVAEPRTRQEGRPPNRRTSSTTSSTPTPASSWSSCRARRASPPRHEPGPSTGAASMRSFRRRPGRRRLGAVGRARSTCTRSSSPSAIRWSMRPAAGTRRSVGPPRWTPAAVSAHANAVAVAEYLREVLFRNGIDNKGGPIISTDRLRGRPARASGPTSGSTPTGTPTCARWCTARPAAARLALAVGATSTSSPTRSSTASPTRRRRLEYAMQPGALNESYSDIFGIAHRQPAEPTIRGSGTGSSAKGCWGTACRSATSPTRPGSTSRRTCATSGGCPTRGRATGAACTSTAASTTRPPT